MYSFSDLNGRCSYVSISRSRPFRHSTRRTFRGVSGGFERKCDALLMENDTTRSICAFVVIVYMRLRRGYVSARSS